MGQLRRFLHERRPVGVMYDVLRDYFKRRRTSEFIYEKDLEALRHMPAGLLAELHEAVRGESLTHHWFFKKIAISHLVSFERFVTMV